MMVEISNPLTTVWGAGASLATVAASVWAIATSRKKIALVSQEHCHKAMDELNKEIKGIHGRITTEAEEIHEIKGYLEGLAGRKGHK